MAVKKSDTFAKYSGIFSRHLPNTLYLMLILAFFSIVTGVSAMALIHYKMVYDIRYMFVGGVLTGIMALLLPTVFTAVIIRSMRQKLAMKYVVFIALIGELYYMVFIIAGSLTYLFTGIAVAAGTVIIVGDASIFAWWLFVDKIVFGDRKKAALGAIVQPTINLLLFVPASTFMFALSGTIGILLLKLYGGIAIFLVVSYLTIYIFEKPMKGGLGLSGIDAFSQILQNWLFNFTITVPKENKRNGFGKKVDISASTMVFKDLSGRIKALFFVPEVHFGPAGVIGGSNFPYMLERYAGSRYKAPIFVMHGAVNEDYNPISDTQLVQVKKAMDESIGHAKPCGKSREAVNYYVSSYNGANIVSLNFGGSSLVTLTRAPRVTEDIDPPVALAFTKMLEARSGKPILIDAHNSRYESAPKEELDGVKFNSAIMRDYIRAIGSPGTGAHRGRSIRLGVSSLNIYRELGHPADLAPGNMNMALFKFNGFGFAMILFNCNNLLPSLRNEILSYLKRRYGIDSEVYTTDTHYVNSLREGASNVLGRKTRFEELRPLLDRAIGEALGSMGTVRAYSKSVMIRKFSIWGHGSRERIGMALNTSLSMAKTFVPIIVVGGLILASWVVSLI